jgi:leucyl-tRNA synthetase
MDTKYNPKQVEQKWQERWEQRKLFQVLDDPGKKKYYLL